MATINYYRVSANYENGSIIANYADSKRSANKMAKQYMDTYSYVTNVTITAHERSDKAIFVETRYRDSSLNTKVYF